MVYAMAGVMTYKRFEDNVALRVATELLQRLEWTRSGAYPECKICLGFNHKHYPGCQLKEFLDAQLNRRRK